MIERDRTLRVRAANRPAAADFFRENYGIDEDIQPDRETDWDDQGLAVWTVPVSEARWAIRPVTAGG